MPITIAKYKCNECDDIFEATSEGWSLCKCKKSEVKPSYFSTSYKREKGNCFTSLESKTYYFEDDFLILNDELKHLYLEARALAESLDFRVWERHDKAQDGSEFLNSISFLKGESNGEYGVEWNNIEMNIGLSKKYDRPNQDEIKNRLELFIEFLNDMKDDKIKIKSRKVLLEYSDKNDVHWHREQLKEYDYTFSF